MTVTPAPLSGAGQQRLLDTHCHLDAFTDPVAILRAASAAEVDIVAVTEDPSSYRRMRTRLGSRPGVALALGLHPLRVAALAPHELTRFVRMLPESSWIGEIGLDFSAAGSATKKQQLQIFEEILAQPLMAHRPVTVHSRGAHNETISRLIQAKVPAILHWFTGSVRAAEAAIDGGLWFSINQAMTRSPRRSTLLQLIPRDRVVLETDGPYCRDGGRPFAPAALRNVVADLAQIWGIPVQDARSAIIDNQHRLLSLDR